MAMIYLFLIKSPFIVWPIFRSKLLSTRFCDCSYCFNRMKKKKRDTNTHTWTLYYMGVSRNLVRGLLFHIKVQAFPLSFQAICVCSMPTKYIANSIGCSYTQKASPKKRGQRSLMRKSWTLYVAYIPEIKKNTYTWFMRKNAIDYFCF